MALPGKGSEFKSCGTFGWKVRTGEVLWSAETCKILRYPRETRPALELIFDRIHPEDRERVRQLFDDAKKTGMKAEPGLKKPSASPTSAIGSGTSKRGI